MRTFWVESGAHHIVIVPGQHRDAGARLPVPDADGLVVGRVHDPWVLLVEGDRADVVQVAEQREEAPPQLVVPHFDLVVVAARYEQRLRLVEVHAADGAIVLIEAVNQRAHAVVPELRAAATVGISDVDQHVVQRPNR